MKVRTSLHWPVVTAIVLIWVILAVAGAVSILIGA